MASYGYNPDFGDVLSECFERAGMNPAQQDIDRLISGVRSANYVMQDFSNRGIKEYELAFYEITPLVVGQQSYQLPQQYLRPLINTRRRSGADLPVLSISREDYEDIPNKLVEGAISEAFWDASGAYTAQPRTLWVWPTSENTTDILRGWWIQSPQIMQAQSLSQTAPIATEWLDAFCYAVAVRLAMKFNPSMLANPAASPLLLASSAAFEVARQADRNRAPARFRMSVRGRRGWR